MPKKDPKIESLERKAKKAREEIKYRKICQKYNMKPLETSREYTQGSAQGIAATVP